MLLIYSHSHIYSYKVSMASILVVWYSHSVPVQYSWLGTLFTWRAHDFVSTVQVDSYSPCTVSKSFRRIPSTTAIFTNNNDISDNNNIFNAILGFHRRILIQMGRELYNYTSCTITKPKVKARSQSKSKSLSDNNKTNLRKLYTLSLTQWYKLFSDETTGTKILAQ